ncbi:MAG: MerR family transcriptional regulator [Dactylosporangium sp.]|nr:MerR family transcriptional regulator [Dactylosporangium sp.]NNJ60653.1 MerR family transcriptional regulator [Dactylosporangium sp.]
MSRYSPGQVAERTGFSLDTLRYYERIGLLDNIARTGGGQRTFTDDDVSWLGLLRCLRETGMPIASMLRFAELVRGGEETIAERITLLEDHDREVAVRIASLRTQQERIQAKIRWYRAAEG